MQKLMESSVAKRLLFLVLCLSIVIIAGCSGGGVKRADKTIDSAETLKAEFSGLDAQIDTTLTALEGVVGAKNGDLRVAFDAYTAQLKNLNAQAKKVVSRANDLRKRSQTYLNQWEKQMAEVQNPALRERVAQRRAQASAQFEQARDELERIQQDYQKFSTDLNDIKVALDNDLNPAGVSAIEPIIGQAKQDAVPVKKDISTIISALDKIIAAFANMQPQQ
ncbi:MAG: DUF2959 family protein [Planctomycetota bacterium]|jgi:DNA repair exonuclease SbcCD ATPase subunit